MADLRGRLLLVRRMNAALYSTTLVVSWGIAINISSGWLRFVFVGVAALHVIDMILMWWIEYITPERAPIITARFEGEGAKELERVLGKMFGRHGQDRSELQ